VKETRKQNLNLIKFVSPDVMVVDPSAVRWQVQLLQKRRAEYLRLGQAEMGKKNYSTASYYFQEVSHILFSLVYYLQFVNHRELISLARHCD